MINTTLNKEAVPMKKPSYPYLARGNGGPGSPNTSTVFFVTGNGEAVCLQRGDRDWYVGERTSNLIMSSVTPLACDEVLSMSNKSD